MPLFKYQGRDNHSHLISGERLSDSSDSLSIQLFQEGITPISITLQENKGSFLKNFKLLFESKKISNTHLALFTRQMYTLTKSGVPVSSAIRHLSKTSQNIRLEKVLIDISNQLEAGKNLSSALEQYPDIFSPLVIAMVQVGQNTGRLDNAFLRLTEYLELENSAIKRVKTAIRYPIFVVVSIVIGIFIINIFVIPAFANVYMRANIPLPWMTKALISFSSFFTTYWLYLLVVFSAAGIATHQYLKSPSGRYAWNKYQLEIPIIGHLLQRVILLRFSETFAIVVNSGIPINDGLTLVAQSINNQYAREEIYGMKETIQRGGSIFQAAASCKLFTGLELQMLAVSEETGELGEMLNEIAHHYQSEVDYDLKHLIDVLEPLLLLGIAIMVLFLALAVYMPIWNMVKLIHRG